jgi:hypothetical protein
MQLKDCWGIVAIVVSVAIIVTLLFLASLAWGQQASPPPVVIDAQDALALLRVKYKKSEEIRRAEVAVARMNEALARLDVEYEKEWGRVRAKYNVPANCSFGDDAALICAQKGAK